METVYEWEDPPQQFKTQRELKKKNPQACAPGNHDWNIQDEVMHPHRVKCNDCGVFKVKRRTRKHSRTKAMTYV